MSRHAPSTLHRAATSSPYCSAARPMRSAIVFEPVDLVAAVVPACIAFSSRTVRQERDSMSVRAERGEDVRLGSGGGASGLRTPRGLTEVGEEEGLVDPALEDRDAHLHALRDDFLAFEAGLASELGGRQVIRHWRDPPLDVCNVLHI